MVLILIKLNPSDNDFAFRNFYVKLAASHLCHSRTLNAISFL